MNFVFDKDKITKLREQKGLSQYKLGKLVGRKRQTINDWENGANVPTIPSLLKLSGVLETSPGSFFIKNLSY